MSRVDNIAKFAQKKEEAAKVEETASLNRIEDYKKRIRELKPRIDELLGVGNACLEYNIPLEGHTFGFHEGYDTHQFISNGKSHLVGFISEKNKPFSKVGKIGGGACNWDLTTDGETIDVSGDAERVLKLFLDGFDAFETEFYAYVDKITEE